MLLIGLINAPVAAQPTDVARGADPTSAPSVTSQPARGAQPVSKAFGTRLDSEPPAYVRPLSARGIPGLDDMTWLDVGLEHRTRFELRDDYYFRGPPPNDDYQFLLRSRAYFGVHDILDPLRGVLEFQDARQFNSAFPEDARDVNENEIVQAFAELFFADALGPGYPLRAQAGRMTFEYVDRKLFGRINWRNTQNAFDGARIRIGQPASDFQLDVFAGMPVERLLRRWDRPDEERWVYGVAGAVRAWAELVTLEPYYFVLDEDRKPGDVPDRTIHTLGLHTFGPVGRSRFDYDTDVAFQFGEDGPREHDAFAASAELGYTFTHDWKPRWSVSGLYASGDRDREDDSTQRFDRLFAPAHPLSASDLFTWQNVISPKTRIEFQPTKKLRADASYGVYWVASPDDAWVVPNRRDGEGQDADFLGHELEFRLRYALCENADVETGYTHFIPGSFVRNSGPAADSDFFYVAVTIRF